MRARPNDTAAPGPVEVAHSIRGRLRLRIPGLDRFPAAADYVTAQLEGADGVHDVRVVGGGRSLRLRYEPGSISPGDLAAAAARSLDEALARLPDRGRCPMRATTTGKGWRPLLLPTLGILIVLGVGRIFFGDFATIYAIVGDNGTLFPTTDVIDTYVFRSLRTVGDFGTTAAIGLFQSVVGFVFVFAAVLVQRRIDKESSIL